MSGRIRLDKGELPWAPLVPGGEGLNRAPAEPVALKRRLGELFGVDPAAITIASTVTAALNAIVHEFGSRAQVQVPFDLDAPDLADRLAKRPLVVIESGVEFIDEGWRSLAPTAALERELFVIRTLDAYGIADQQMVAIIHAPQHDRAVFLGLRAVLPSTPLQRIVEAAIAPSRMPVIEARIALIKAERARVASALGLTIPRSNVLTIPEADPATFARFGIEADWNEDIARRPVAPVCVTVGTPEENDLILAAMGVTVPARPPARTATIARDTKETRIVATVDLDRADPVHIQTGIGFYDHMLEQVARHGGFSLALAAEGDLHIEAHHTIEDCALALGEALRVALGDRKGVARFGFVAPLDEAEAAVTLDLSGRPLAKFEGDFRRPMIGEYPTEMTAHVFRSLADAMRATIHVRVTGEDDHHKTEAAFKSFGRALRQAIRVEGDAVPSTKGVLA